MAAVPDLRQAFIVGAQRCGTTSVATTLAQHPEVALAQPLRPEPKWFLDPGASDRVPAYLDTFFGDVGAEVRLRLEKSTSYLESGVARTEIAAAFPDAQLIVVLRDPVDRAVSHYGFSVARRPRGPPGGRGPRHRRRRLARGTPTRCRSRPTAT